MTPTCSHCGDRHGTTPATHRATWRVTDEDETRPRREADLCDDHLADLRRAEQRGWVYVVRVVGLGAA